MPRLQKLCKEFLALNDMRGYPQEAEYYLERENLAGWNIANLPWTWYDPDRPRGHDMYVFSSGRIASVIQPRFGDNKVIDLAGRFSEATRTTGERGYNMFTSGCVEDLNRYLENTRARIDRLR